MKFGAAWKITGFEKQKKGLITICAEKDVFNGDDDEENEIVDRWKYETKHSYTIFFTNASQMTFNPGDTKQMKYEIKEQGIIVESAMPVEFSSSNEDVAVVDVTGLVTAAVVGSCDIGVHLQENTNVSAACTLTVEETPIMEKLVSSLLISLPR